MSNEPGLTLGRLVAAERNALAAIESVKNVNARTGDYAERLQRLEQQVIDLVRENNILKARMYGAVGGGPTSTG